MLEKILELVVTISIVWPVEALIWCFQHWYFALPLYLFLISFEKTADDISMPPPMNPPK